MLVRQAKVEATLCMTVIVTKVIRSAGSVTLRKSPSTTFHAPRFALAVPQVDCREATVL